jgi:microfibrillar-associated protein 1
MTNQSNLSRDELALLLGASQSSDILATARPDPKPSRQPIATRTKREEDVSAMDSKQAAALVARQFAERQGREAVQRHRAKKKMEYHRLLPDHNEGIETTADKNDMGDAAYANVEEMAFPARKRKKIEASVVQRKRRDSDGNSSSSSSDSSSDESSRAPRRRRRGSSSSEASDDSADLRRRRARERRHGKEEEEKNEATAVVQRRRDEDDSSDDEKVKLQQRDKSKIAQVAPAPQRNHSQTGKPNNRKDDSSSDSESSTSSSESSSSSSQEEQTIQPISKPLFVPKSKRGTVALQEAQEQKLQEISERKEKEKQKRTLQSRALVAEAVAEKTNISTATIGDEDEFEGGDHNLIIPDDTDGTTVEEREKERDAWEVRELLRILHEADVLADLTKHKLETRQRRNMTDEEIYREGHIRPVGEARRKSNHDKSKYLQRFHHRGAFYMDEDTLGQAGEDDVRHRAKEYSRAATGEDKIDKSALPEVMQVKKFGFAGYSTKYKGLAKEDTTDRGLDFVPIRSNKKGDGRR